MKNKTSIGLSSFALFFAILAVGFTFCRTTPMEADWMGILVGVLALLTTVLLGWQISSYVGFKKDLIRDIEREKIDLHQIIEKIEFLIEEKIVESTSASSIKNEYYFEGLMNYTEGYALLINNNTLKGRFGIVYLIMTTALVNFLKYGSKAYPNVQKCLSNLDLLLIDFEQQIKHQTKGFHGGYMALNFKDLDLSHNNDFNKLKTDILNFSSIDSCKEYIKMFLELEKRREDLIKRYSDIDIVAELQMKKENDDSFE